MKSKKLLIKIINVLEKNTFKLVNLDTVIKADHIIQRSGESFKKLMISFNDNKGRELCLRPDLTTVSCLRYIDEKIRTRKKIYYEGEVFRKKDDNNRINSYQIGWEIIGGNRNRFREDKEIISTSLKCLKNLNFKNVELKIGNIELFNLFISKLKIPKRFKTRLRRHFWREKYFNTLLNRLTSNLEGEISDKVYNKKKYFQLLNKNKNKIIAGRSIDEISRRFLNKLNDPRGSLKIKREVKIIKDFLKIKCSIKNAVKRLNLFFEKNQIDLKIDKNYFPITDYKSSKLKITFETSFGRELEYYTGMVFKISVKNKDIISGGRYDNLIFDLGSKKKIQAVGAAINLEVK